MIPADLGRMAQTLAEEIPPEHLATPLEYIFADNFRCRVLCNLLSVIGSGQEVASEVVPTCRDFLLRDFLTHLADEKQALFPLLMERTKSADGVLEAMRKERPGFATINRLAADLEHRARPDRDPASLIGSFVVEERHHICFENVVLLPVARKRLGPPELEWLARAMRGHRERVRRPEVPL